MKINEMTKRLKALSGEVKAILRDSGFEVENDFYPDEFDRTKTLEDGDEVADLTADEWQRVNEYRTMLDKLDIMFDRFDYLNQPITHSGKLYLTSNDRFVVDGCELCCGYRVEYQQYDEEHECYYWVADRVEYSDSKGGYYFYNSGLALSEGIVVRVRW